MKVKAIHAEVERLLGGSVSRFTVSELLAHSLEGAETTLRTDPPRPLPAVALSRTRFAGTSSEGVVLGRGRSSAATLYWLQHRASVDRHSAFESQGGTLFH